MTQSGGEPDTTRKTPGLRLVGAEASRERIGVLAAALEAGGDAPTLLIPDADPATPPPAGDPAAIVVLCWTPAACGADAVILEAMRAKRDGRLVEALLTPCRPPSPFGRRFGPADLTQWDGDAHDDAFKALTEIVRARMEGRAPGARVLGAQLLRWGGASAAGVAALTFMLNFGSLKQTLDSFLNPAASEKALAATDAKVDAVLTMLKANAPAGAPSPFMGADPNSDAALRETIAALLSAQSGARGRAAQRLEAGDAAGALDALQQSASQAEKAAADLAETWKQIGAIASYSDPPKALDALQRAIALVPDDPVARLQLGDLYLRLGRLDEAETEYINVGGLQGIDDAWMVRADSALGALLKARSEYVDATEILKGALAFHEKLGDVDGQIYDLLLLSDIARETDDTPAGRVWLAKAVALQTPESTDPVRDAYARGSLADMDDDLVAARREFAAALALSEQLNDIGFQTGINASIARVARKQKKYAEAETHYRRAVDLAVQIGDPQNEAIALEDLSVMAEERKKMRPAIDYAKRARDAYARAGMKADSERLTDWLKSQGAR